MTTIRPFTCEDMFRFNNVNLDPLTETYGLSFYLQYLAHWPEYFQVAEAPNGDVMGYTPRAKMALQADWEWEVKYNRHSHNFFAKDNILFSAPEVSVADTWRIFCYCAHVMGKAEGHGENWHGHVTALTVAPEYRRLGLAATLMAGLEDISEKKRSYFVDLFVRVSNKVAVDMYKQLGYSVYRRVLEYYSGDPDEDAFDMRKALSRDINKKSVIPLTHPVRPEDIE